MHKIYRCGKDFLADNLEIIKAHPVETCFFELDSNFDAVNSQTYAVKVMDGDKYILALRMEPYPLMIFGYPDLTPQLVQIFAQEGYLFQSVLGYPQICEVFLAEYEKICGGSHQTKHAMDIMFCQKVAPCDFADVCPATDDDAEQIAHFAVDFAHEALGENQDYQDRLLWVRREIGSFAVLKQNGQIVSVAQRTREMTALCALAYVYTLPQYRNRGYSRKVVTFVTQSILDSGKLAYLFVDKANPVSNHLYQKVGYTYAMPQYEISYFPKK